jgi:hypothetical protein
MVLLKFTGVVSTPPVTKLLKMLCANVPVNSKQGSDKLQYICSTGFETDDSTRLCD